ncbi:ammonium transporter [Rhizobium alvei]|uniref:Ammonium transporter n=1 Tax=Rhizobium alvei TaxID=1132659 RepID=A0ABT8YPV8_9HYPH|nr:ammonium transporter [Rhizobium alvei]MDO6965349.1 ammonium transporter [Rhizobium alvei]
MRRSIIARLSTIAVSGFLLAFLASVSTAFATDGKTYALKQDLDLSWLMMTASLVMMMQVGFLLLEAGMVRSKNSINVAQKNLLDFVFGIIAFASIGFMIAFGSSSWLPVGFNLNFLLLSNLTDWEQGFFVFQVMFCGTAATIVSGAVAERMKLSAYVAGSLVLSGLIYPIFVHWAWGNALAPNTGAFLANAGFVDFAGSTVVHATGGWISLAACLVIGARSGRFNAEGKPVRINGHSPVLSTTGALILFFGWIGFNGGSTLHATPEIAHIILNTVLAGGVGACVGYLIGHKNGVILPEKPFTGMLGGLVAVTAGCQVLNPMGAMIIGAAGAGISLWAIDWIERRWKIDDAVGAIGVHAFGGVAGTLLLAVLAPVENLPTGDRLSQFAVQLGGSALNFVWSFTLAYAFFWILAKTGKIRVSSADEEIGLNIAEHDTRLGVGHVEDAFSDLLTGKADLSRRLPVETGGDAEKLTALFNRLMDDIQEQERVRHEMENFKRDREEEERVAALANATFEAIFIHREGTIIDANLQMAQLFGQPIDRLIGIDVLDLIEPSEREKVREALLSTEDTALETLAVSANGDQIPVEVRGRDITYRNAAARVVCLIDLRERKEAERRIRHLAQHDPLTGLPNRALFNAELEIRSTIAAAGGHSSLVLVDLDRFKDINDIHGHQAGDAVIRETAARLKALAGPRALVARLGGDEFAVILSNTDFESQLSDFGHRLVSEFRSPVTTPSGEKIPCSVSIGMARCPDHADDGETLFALADIALYHSKNSGRNRWAIYRPGMDALVEKRRELETALGNAIENEEFELYLQPRIDSRTANILGYEALLRWISPERGMVSPADFIPVAEASGKIIAIGEWVIAEACRIIQRGLEDKHVSINVSPLQFRRDGFVEKLAEIVGRHAVDPSRIELEITESVLIDDDQGAERTLARLKAAGFSIALDDFGTGYSSLSYLSRFPFDTIKVDRSFVSNLGQSDSAPVIIRSIVELGAGLGMQVVAEGVENIDEALFLAAAGCDQLQGFLLGKPVPVEKRAMVIDDTVSTALKDLQAGQGAAIQILRATAEAMHGAQAMASLGIKSRRT